MVEELVQIMVARWSLPENQVREFMEGLFPEGTSSDASIEDLREKTAELLQNMVLETASTTEN